MGYRLKEYREKTGMTQEELSKRSGVSRGTIATLETDDSASTTTKTLAKLAKALGVTIMQLFFN